MIEDVPTEFFSDRHTPDVPKGIPGSNRSMERGMCDAMEIPREAHGSMCHVARLVPPEGVQLISCKVIKGVQLIRLKVIKGVQLITLPGATRGHCRTRYPDEMGDGVVQVRVGRAIGQKEIGFSAGRPFRY